MGSLVSGCEHEHIACVHTVWVISKTTTYGVHLIPQSDVISNCKQL